MKTDFVQAGAVRLQYFEDGEGPDVVVLVHGYVSSGRVWRLTQEALAGLGIRSLAISNRGAGDSDRTSSEDDYSVQSFARDLYEAVQTLGLKNFILCGHSMGGLTATQFSLDHPELLKALVLLDSASHDGRALPRGWEQEMRNRIEQTGAPRESAERLAPVPDDFRAALQADIDRNPIERLIGSRRSLSEIRLRSRLTGLKMPVLVVGGDQDVTVSVDKILTDFLALPPASRFLHFFHGTGHSPNVAIAVDFARLVGSFVRETLPRLETTVAPGI